MPRFAANLGFLFPEPAFTERFGACAAAGFGVVEFAQPWDLEAREIAELLVTDKIAVFAIDATTGALTEIAGSPFPAGPPWSPPAWLAFAPSGVFAYVAHGSGCVVGFAVDTFTGGLTEIAGSPFAAGRLPTSITVDPSGRFAYLTYRGDVGDDHGYVSAYSIDAVTGALAEIGGSPYATGICPQFIVVDPTGRFAYVGKFGSEQYLSLFDSFRGHRRSDGNLGLTVFRRFRPHVDCV